MFLELTKSEIISNNYVYISFGFYKKILTELCSSGKSPLLGPYSQNWGNGGSGFPKGVNCLGLFWNSVVIFRGETGDDSIESESEFEFGFGYQGGKYRSCSR